MPDGMHKFSVRAADLHHSAWCSEICPGLRAFLFLPYMAAGPLLGPVKSSMALAEGAADGWLVSQVGPEAAKSTFDDVRRSVNPTHEGIEQQHLFVSILKSRLQFGQEIVRVQAFTADR